MRLLVCGGRGYSRPWNVHDELDKLRAELGKVELVITGGAKGADHYAGEWARANLIPLCIFVANWRGHGDAAGPLRNAAMVEFGAPDMVVAFAGGRGTADMVGKARHIGVPVREFS